MKITFETKAWITEYNNVTPQALQTEAGASSLTYHHTDMSKSGWTFAGNATITVDIVDRDTMVNNKVAALREQKKEISAEAAMRVNQIEGQIQNLLVITHQPAAE